MGIVLYLFAKVGCRIVTSLSICESLQDRADLGINHSERRVSIQLFEKGSGANDATTLYSHWTAFDLRNKSLHPQLPYIGYKVRNRARNYLLKRGVFCTHPLFPSLFIIFQILTSLLKTVEMKPLAFPLKLNCDKGSKHIIKIIQILDTFKVRLPVVLYNR